METNEEKPKKGNAGIALVALILWVSLLVYALLYVDGSWQIAIFVSLAFSLVVAIIAMNRKLTFGWALLISVVLSPVLGLIFTLISKKVNDADAPAMPEFATLPVTAQQKFTQPAFAAPVKTTPGNNVADELRKLNELRKEGIITDDEFNAQKSKLLNS